MSTSRRWTGGKEFQMKQLWYRFQFLLITLLLTASVVLGYLVVRKIDWHYDVTREKVHSLPDETARVLQELAAKPVEVVAFYPKDDPSREALTIFLKQCQAAHARFQFNLYDPIRRPKLAEEYRVEQNYTTVIRSAGHEERIYNFTEETFTNALFRLAHPRKLDVCFVTGHQELNIKSNERNGAMTFARNLQNGEVSIHSIVLARDGVPDSCNVTVMAGPHTEPAPDEFEKLRKAFEKGRSLIFLIDPMDLGVGRKFIDFFKAFGVVMGENVLVDKASRVVGGDFLMPAVTTYAKHESMKRMTDPTFFPVTRTVQPSTDIPQGLEVSPLAITNDSSWAESDLALLEDGKAAFDAKHDIAGPLPLAVAVEKKPNGGRMVIVGDSDFLTNGYLAISQNLDFAVEILKWAGRDSRFIHVRPRRTPFKPLLLKEYQRQGLLVLVLGMYPLALFIPISIYLFIRSRTA